jgi:hypothetical protein
MKLLRWILRYQVRFAATVFLPFGIVVIVGGLILYCFEWRFVRSAQHTTGTITMLESRIDHDSDEYFYPHFTFSKPDGTSFEIASRVGTNPPDFEVGEQVPVIYGSHDPETAKIATTFQIYGFSIIFGILGTTFVGLGFLAQFLKSKFFPV